MTKDEKDAIVSAIAGLTREVSTKAFVELNEMLYDEKTCENCKYCARFGDTIGRCENKNIRLYKQPVHYSDGCNKWESK